MPVIVMVLSATAIPIELRGFDSAALNFRFSVSDVVANVAGYLPVGFVLGGLGLLRAVITSALIAAFAETSQFAMMHRDPSGVDVATNVLGALLGAALAIHWKARSPELRINKWHALVAVGLALILAFGVWTTSGDPLNPRGASVPGTLEAYWKIDENHGRVALDSSGHGLEGRFHTEPTRGVGTNDGAVTLDGATNYIDFGHSTAFRLTSSMTISAWIKPTSFPKDDAAIVSTFDSGGQNGLGYQLDTTVDTGPRTIGFKLGDVCGKLMIRYGATPLIVDRWYHVAGVYDAQARSLDVYLNGELDDGRLLGSVSGAQRSSRRALYVGTRSDVEGFEFAGSIDDVRLYSLALTGTEIAAEMHGATIDGLASRRATLRGAEGEGKAARRASVYAPCTWESEPEDARIPGAAGILGVLVAVACVGFRRRAGWLLCLLASVSAGLLLLPATASTLPALNLWTIPLTSLAGGASVAVSVRRSNDLDR